jgi:hypothetical protein
LTDSPPTKVDNDDAIGHLDRDRDRDRRESTEELLRRGSSM